MEAAGNPDRLDSRESDEDDENEVEKLKTEEKKESELNLKRNFTSDKKGQNESLPTVLANQTPERHVFKGDKDTTSSNARDQKNQAHQELVRSSRKEDKNTGNSSSNHQSKETKSHDIPTENELLPNFNIDSYVDYPRSGSSTVPSYLKHLHEKDTVSVYQYVDPATRFNQMLGQNDDLTNLYVIKDTNGQSLYYAYETTTLVAQIASQGARPFQIHVMDYSNNEAIYFTNTCGMNQFFCCFPVGEVYSPPLEPVGAIFRCLNPLRARFEIVDVSERKIFKIRGPCCCFTTRVVDFTIHTLDSKGTKVGVIRRELPKDLLSTPFYVVTFPENLDVKMKAVLLGAVFYISLKRTGWVLRNVEDPETVSGHMYRMSVMTFLIPETSGVDRTRCMKLSIVHDLAECIVGDLTPFCGVEPSEKHRQEDAAMKELTQMIGESGTEIYKLYKEYEAQVTDESKFVKDLDRLDMVLQAYEYEKLADKPGKLEEFFTSTLNKFHFPWTIDIVKELYKQRNLHIKKGKV